MMFTDVIVTEKGGKLARDPGTGEVLVEEDDCE
jgi:hypothetical protein